MPASNPQRRIVVDAVAVVARLVLGGVFIYMGVNKALHPVEFLKLVRQYDAIHSPVALNLVASTLPWFELFCGVLLVFGVAVRGTAVMALAMLIPFTILVFLRAWAMHGAGGLPFCAIKFDCGCGAGEVLICRKLLENATLALVSIGLIARTQGWLCLRHTLIGPRQLDPETASFSRR